MFKVRPPADVDTRDLERSQYPSIPIDPAAIRREKAEAETRKKLRPEIAALQIATTDVSLASVLSAALDRWNDPARLKNYVTITEEHDAAELVTRGLLMPMRGDMGTVVGYQPAQSLLDWKPAVPARKDDTGACLRPGSLLGLHR